MERSPLISKGYNGKVMMAGIITENVRRILNKLPDGVELVAAAKTRSVEEIEAAMEGGIKIVGENYIQEADRVFGKIGHKVKWHFIGHLQVNKVKKAVGIFDMIETVDSVRLASEIDKRCAAIGRVMPVLIEINSGREAQKFGVLPEEAGKIISEIALLQNIKITGLMTMGPLAGDPEDSRPYFVETGQVFEKIKSLGLPRVEMRYLSMGMSNSYQVAVEQGANVVRIGTKIFGERQCHR